MKICIVGSGLSGSIISTVLSFCHDVVVIDVPDNFVPPHVSDLGYPANNDTIIGYGRGGSTRFWHNAMVEIPTDEGEQSDYWRELSDHIVLAKRLLGLPEKFNTSEVESFADQVKETLGLTSKDLDVPMIIPHRRLNMWNRFAKVNRSRLVLGHIKNIDSINRKLCVCDRNSEEHVFEFDKLVVCAGGLGSPLILKKFGLVSSKKFPYEDHPSGFIGSVEFKNRVPNFTKTMLVDGVSVSIRQSLRYFDSHNKVSFQLRPFVKPSEFSASRFTANLITNLRNRPFRIKSYLDVLSNFGVLMEVISFKFRTILRMKKFSIFFVASDRDGESTISFTKMDGTDIIQRDWKLQFDHLDWLQKAFLQVMARCKGVHSVSIDEQWMDNIISSSHHSGTLLTSINIGLDGYRRFWLNGHENIMVVDASTLPYTSASNTGIAIASQALYFSREFLEDSERFCSAVLRMLKA